MSPYEPIRWRPSLVTRYVPTIIVVVVLVVVALAGLGGGSLSLGPSDVPLPPSPIEGVVVAVDALSLTEVLTFDMRTSDGTVIQLAIGTLENAGEFTPSHLNEHKATSVPIRAFYRLENNIPVVYRLEDATPALVTPAAT